MCNGRIMDKLEKGKEAMHSIFVRLGTSSSVSPQTPAFAGEGEVHSETKTDLSVCTKGTGKPEK